MQRLGQPHLIAHMPLKRSRPNTEIKFQDAVLELVAKEGCVALGINVVAQKAGADKVLLYRYFGDLNGLLQRVAESRSWLPDSKDVLSAVSHHRTDCTRYLKELFHYMVKNIQADATTHQLVRWRKAHKNPLTNYFSEEWHRFWQDLLTELGHSLDHEQKLNWKHAFHLIALLIESELCGEGMDYDCLETIAVNLNAPEAYEASASHYANEEEGDRLPTNLL